MITMSKTIRRSIFRLPIIVALCAALVMTAGCSALRFGYNQAADLAYWWLDGFVDFNDTQTVRVRDALAGWFVWHRGTQLPDYARLLVRAQSEVVADSTPERVCEWWTTLGARMETSFERAVPDGAELMLSISPKQIQHMERRYAKANDEFRDEFLQADAAKRRRLSVERAVERAELLYGKLDDAQRELVAATVAQSPFDAELWFSERKRRQQDALRILRSVSAEGAGRDKAQAALRAYIDRWSRSPREEYRRYSETLSSFNCAFAAKLHNTTNAAQRQVAVQKLKGWEADVRALAADAVK
jgi:Family of unknown function (DUF6279)